MPPLAWADGQRTLASGYARDRLCATEDVTAAIAVGALRVGEKAGLPLLHYPLEATQAAHDAVEQGAVGKVLIDVGAAS